MKLKDLDYFRTKDDIFFLVKGYYHPPKRVFAYPVFWPADEGNRFHPILKKLFRKDVSDVNKKIFKLKPHYQHSLIPSNTPLVPLNEIVEIYYPQEKTADFLKTNEDTVWYKIFRAVSKIADVPKENIGIFGSYLINLSRNTSEQQVKDIDFVIYGIENCLQLKKKFDFLLDYLNFTHISTDHIKYHTEKFGSSFDPQINSFSKTLQRKWSAIQVKKGLLSTLRFAYKGNEIPPNPISTKIMNPIQIQGRVLDDFGTNFMPRTFTVKVGNKEYKVVTYFWGFYQVVQNGDQVLITGNLHQDGETVSVDSIDHGIKIIN